MPAETKIKSSTLYITLKQAQPSEVIRASDGEDSPDSGSGGKIVSFVACEETPFERWDWFKGRYNLILSHNPDHVRLDRVNNGACMFIEGHDTEDAEKRIGKVVKCSIESNQLIVEARLNSLEAGQRFYQEVIDQTEPPKSVGAAIYETEVVETALYEEDEDGYKKLIRPATLRAIDWELMEVSAVTVPAIAGAAVKEAANEQQYEMLMHGDPGMPLDIPEEIVKASTKTEEKAKPKEKPYTKKPTKPKGKTMPSLREEFQELDHEALIDRAIELKRKIDSKDEEMTLLRDELAQLNRKDTIRDQYFTLRNQAEKLLGKAQLSAHTFEKHFSDSAIADINALCKKDNAEVKLEALSMFLDQMEESAPKLNLELKTKDEPLTATAKTEARSLTPTGEDVDSYTKKLLAKMELLK